MRRALVLLMLLPACPNAPTRPDATTPTPTVEAEKKETPRRTDALDTLLGTDLTRWIVELSSSPSSATRPSLSSQPDLGPKTRAALVSLFEQVEVAATHEGEEPPALGPATEAVNNALRTEGRDYAIDTVLVPTDDRVPSYFVLVFSFTVDRQRIYVDESGHRHLVRWVRRLDQIAYRYRVLGFASKDREPIVLLGSIDSMLVREVLGQQSIGGEVSGTQVAAAAAAACARAAGNDANALATLVAQRRMLLTRWNQTLRDRGVVLKPPAGRLLPRSWIDELGQLVASDEIDKLKTLESELATPAMSLAYQTLNDLAATAIDHHELQHALDFSSSLSTELELELQKESREHVVFEISALLAELARAPKASHLTLARLAPLAHGERNSLDRIAVRIALAYVAGETGEPSGEELDVIIKSLALMTAEKLSGAAASAWTRLFGRPLPTLNLVRK